MGNRNSYYEKQYKSARSATACAAQKIAGSTGIFERAAGSACAGGKGAAGNACADGRGDEGDGRENRVSEGEDADAMDGIKEYGQAMLNSPRQNHHIHLLSVIGEIEGHECLPSTTKTTKYEHVLPQLAVIEDSDEVDGLLLILNTVGGDVESGLAIAEMVASISKPSVSLVLGGSHSIGVPLAVSTDYSFIVPSGTMVIHPVRMNGTIIGAKQTYDYFKQMQNRILHFIQSHSGAEEERLVEMMMNTDMLSKDLGTILVGEEAVREGLIDAVGGICEAVRKLHEMIENC